MTTTHDTNDRHNAHETRDQIGDEARRASHDDPPHRGYILAVKEALSLHGLSATVVHISGVAVLHADLELTTADRQPVVLRWDELTGWSCHTPSANLASAISFGVSAVPLPMQIASWVKSVIAHPSFRARRVQGPLITPDLTTRLARYHTGGTT